MNKIAQSPPLSSEQLLLNRTSRLTLIVGVILLILKFYAYRLTGSIAIYSDALESIVNVVTGALTIFVIWYASLPADEDHPYGHGKVESVAASFEGGAIAFAGIMILVDSFTNIFLERKDVQDIDSGAFLVFFAGLVNGAYGLWVLKKGRELHSESLKATGAHLFSDMLTSLGVLLGLLLVKITEIPVLDPVIALFFGGYLIYTGLKIFLSSIEILVDAQDRELLMKLSKLFEQHYRSGVIQIHFTRIIRSGRHHHIDCHMVIPEFWSVEKAHEFSEEFESDILADYDTSGEFHIHLDPCRQKYCDSCDFEPCPIRSKPFMARLPFSYEELVKHNG